MRNETYFSGVIIPYHSWSRGTYSRDTNLFLSKWSILLTLLSKLESLLFSGMNRSIYIVLIFELESLLPSHMNRSIHTVLISELGLLLLLGMNWSIYTVLNGILPRSQSFAYKPLLRDESYVRHFAKLGVGRGYVTVTGSMWLLRGLCDCYGVFVAVTGLRPVVFLKNRSAWLLRDKFTWKCDSGITVEAFYLKRWDYILCVIR